MQQVQNEAKSEDNGTGVKLRSIIWRMVIWVVVVIGLSLAIFLIVLFANGSLHTNWPMVSILSVVSIIYGVVFVSGIVEFVRLLLSLRSVRFSEETCNVPSSSNGRTEKCSTEKPETKVNSRTVEAGRPEFASRNDSDCHPESISNLKNSELEAGRESRKYLISRPEDAKHGVYKSSEPTEYSQDASEVRKYDLKRYGQVNDPVSVRNAEVPECQHSSRLQRNEYWSRRKRYRNDYLLGSRTESRLQQYRNAKPSRSRLRSKSETREYNPKTNEMAKENIFLSTRKQKIPRSRIAEYSSRNETEILDVYEPTSNKGNMTYPDFIAKNIHSLTDGAESDYPCSYRQPSNLLPSLLERGKYLSKCKGIMDNRSANNKEAEHYGPRSCSRILEQLPRNEEGQNCFSLPKTEIKSLQLNNRGTIEEYLPQNCRGVAQNSTVKSKNIKYLTKFGNHSTQHPSIFKEESIGYLPGNKNNEITSYKPNVQMEQQCSLKSMESNCHLSTRLSAIRENQPSRAGANTDLQNRNEEYDFRNRTEYENYLRYFGLVEIIDEAPRYIQGIENCQFRTNETMIHPPRNRARSMDYKPRDRTVSVII